MTAVYKAISLVMADLSKDGIAKASRNQQQGYNFRGIDDVYNALSTTLSAHGLLMLPRVLSRDVVERQTAKGGTLFYVTVEAEFDLVSSEDGSTHTIKTYGEAMDSGDKATNKAMSAAYKYAAMQAFCIPTEGDNDADATTYTIAPKKDTGPSPVDGKDFWKCEGSGLTAHAAKKEGLEEVHEKMRDEIAAIHTSEGWKAWCSASQPLISRMPLSWRMLLREEAEERGRFLGAIND